MTVSSIEPVNNYTGNSSNTRFDFDFLIEDETELIVQHTNSDGLINILQQGIDYSIHETGNKNGSYITFPLEGSSYSVLKEDEKLSLMLTLVIKQEKEIRNSLFFDFNVLEWMFDYIVRILQIFNRKLQLCVKTHEGGGSPDELMETLNNSVLTAVNKANDAQNSAENAANSEAAAANSAENSAFAAHSAAISEDNASIWAEGNDEEVQAIGGIHSAKGWSELSDNADISLDNLNNRGNAKFQYAPFSINSGSADASGNNNTLQLPNGAEIIAQWVQPVLTSNGTMGGNSFAVNSNVFGAGAYAAFDNTSTPAHSAQGVLSGYIDFYNPQALCVKNLRITNQQGSGEMKRASKAGIIYGSDDGSNWTRIKSYTNSVQSDGASWNIDLSDNTDYYKYYRMQSSGTPYSGTETAPYAYWTTAEIEIDALYIASVSNSLICAPCTITTADGRTKTFENNSVPDVSGLANGIYKVLKSYTDGSFSAVSSLTILKTAPASPANNDFWLDTSQYPLALKQYDSGSSQWVINNDLVYIGDVTISNGVITAVNNNYFNACPAFRYPVETYQNGASWYCVYSDGWCEQGGRGSNAVIQLLKPFINANYTVNITDLANGGGHRNWGAVNLTNSNFTGQMQTVLGGGTPINLWRVCGYIK